jgi:transposase-like protein
MLQQIRIATGNENMAKTFGVLVEIDETYAGGKPRKENVKPDKNGSVIPSDKEPLKRGRGTDKTPVAGVKERSSGRVYAQVALPNAKGQKLTVKQLPAVPGTVCADNTTVASDDFSGYNILDKKHDNNFIHLSVNHSAGQFSNGKGVHTNGIENFRGILKRGWAGTYHHWPAKHIERYINECAYRQNHRKTTAIFETRLSQCVLKHT